MDVGNSTDNRQTGGPLVSGFQPYARQVLARSGNPARCDISPNVKIGYDLTRKINTGIEYYASYGDLSSFDRLHDQEQQFFLASDLNVSPDWEINFGVGVGTTSATDHLIVKGIIGRRFSWTKKK